MEQVNSFPELSLAQRAGRWVLARQHRVELDPREAGLRAMAVASLNVPVDASSIPNSKP